MDYRLFYLNLLLFMSVSGNRSSNFNSFSVCSLNCHGLKGNIQYVTDLLKSQDVLFISEHWLLEKDFATIEDLCVKHNCKSYLKSSVDPTITLQGRPYGGVGFLCNHLNGITYRTIPSASDRVMGFQIIANQSVQLYLIGVYLPYDNGTISQTELYMETLEYLKCMVDMCNDAPMVILGDLNTSLPESEFLKEKWYTQKPYNKRSAVLHTSLPESEFLKEKWYTQKPYNKRSAVLHEFISQNDLCVANFLFDQNVEYTYKQGVKSS